MWRTFRIIDFIDKGHAPELNGLSHDPLHIHKNTAPRIKSDQGQCNVGDRIQMGHNSSPAPEY